MLRALYTAATGMQAQQINIDTIANNIANVNTTGFKQARAEIPGSALPEHPSGRYGFIDIQHLSRWVAARSRNAACSHGSNLQPGRLSADGQSVGPRYSGTRVLSSPDGQRRNGIYPRRFLPSECTGRAGHCRRQCLPEPQITIPAAAQNIVIGTDGTVSVTLQGQTAAQTVGHSCSWRHSRIRAA